MSVRLHGVNCPCCGNRVASVALEGSPQHIVHAATFTRRSGERVRCRRQWVAVPEPEKAGVKLIEVDGRVEADETLKRETASWLMKLQGLVGGESEDEGLPS